MKSGARRNLVYNYLPLPLNHWQDCVKRKGPSNVCNCLDFDEMNHFGAKETTLIKLIINYYDGRPLQAYSCFCEPPLSFGTNTHFLWRAWARWVLIFEILESRLDKKVITRRAPATSHNSYKSSYNPHKWTYKWVAGVIIPWNRKKQILNESIRFECTAGRGGMDLGLVHSSWDVWSRWIDWDFPPLWRCSAIFETFPKFVASQRYRTVRNIFPHLLAICPQKELEKQRVSETEPKA